MISEKKIMDELNGWVDRFLKHSPFFKVWKNDSIDRAMCEKFLVTFDSLVGSFPALIALGAARVMDERTRVVLAVNLFQECGEGDPRRTHHAIYRKFLATAGIDVSQSPESPFAARWRSDLFGYVQDSKSPGKVLGALAAGEFLAEPALTRIYSVIRPHYPGADQEYFTKHLVLETEHVREITAMLAREAKDETGWAEVSAGFHFGLSAWETYFNRLAEFTAAAK